MEQQQIQAYLDVVQKLLSCHRGEEWIILRQHEDLVDEKLVSVLEQVANYLTAEGEINGARYLHNWAGKLHHILSQPATPSVSVEGDTQAYVDLIQTLLNCQANQQKIQVVLQANQALITPQLVGLMRQVAVQLMQQGDRQTAEYLNTLATEVNRIWIQKRDFQPNFTKANQLAPDPWDDAAQVAEPVAPIAVATPKPESVSVPSAPKPDVAPETAPQTPPETSKSEAPVVIEKMVEQPESSLEAKIETLNDQMGNIGTQMAAIASSLSRLETILVQHLQPPNPLAYLAVLDQAAASGWVISSTEVEQLIGVPPQCAKGKSFFERGNWRFVKAGKIGLQTGWRVEKVHN